MAVVNKVSTQELGAVLIVLGQLMYHNDLPLSEALGGEHAGYIRAELNTLLYDRSAERVDELVTIDEAQLMQCLNSADWINS